jgi:hypothetical protein
MTISCLKTQPVAEGAGDPRAPPSGHLIFGLWIPLFLFGEVV